MSVKFRITLVTAIFLTCASVAVSMFTLRAQRAQLYSESRRRVELALSMLSDMAAPPLAQGDVISLASIADRAAAGQADRVCVADLRGEILVDSAHEMYDASVPAIRAVVKTGHRSIGRRGDLWHGATAVRDHQGRMAGVVYVTFSTRPLDAALTHVTRTTALLMLLFVALGVFVAYGLGRYLSRSLSPLLVGIRKTAGGDFEARIPKTGMVELDEIGRAFNRMSRLVGRQVHDLSALNQLGTKLMSARTLDQFAAALRSACRTLLEGNAFLLSGDPRSGVLSLANEEEPVRRVATASAAFVAANERRIITIGAESDLPSGSEVVSGVRMDSGLVAPLIIPSGETAGVLVIAFDGRERPTPDRQDEVTARAVANLAAPILAALVRAWTQERAVEALRSILHPDALPELDGLEVYAHYEPAEHESGLSGDYYDVFPLGEDLWGVVLGDVSGKGLQAARYTAMVKYVVRSLALQHLSPSRTISQASKILAAQFDELHFVTLFYALLDARRRTLTYCCAGHPPALLYTHASGAFQELSVGGGVVGCDALAGFEEELVTMAPGDLLLLCTDGIVEARSENEEYGLEHLKAVIQANGGRSLKNLARAVADDARAFAGNLVKDDVAVLLVRVSNEPSAGR